MRDLVSAVLNLARVAENRGLGEVEILMSHEAISTLKMQMLQETVTAEQIRLPSGHVKIAGVLVKPIEDERRIKLQLEARLANHSGVPSDFRGFRYEP